MSGGVPEAHKDDTAFATGTHSGSNASSTLKDTGADFKSCGVQVGVAIYNDTDGSNGLVTSVAEDEIGCTLSGGSDNKWDNGDTYSIYITATKDSTISSVWTDRRFGRKTDDEQLVDGLRPEDMDLDEHGEQVFGPGQPIRFK